MSAHDGNNLYDAYVRIGRWIGAFFAHPLPQMPAPSRAYAKQDWCVLEGARGCVRAMHSQSTHTLARACAQGLLGLSSIPVYACHSVHINSLVIAEYLR